MSNPIGTIRKDELLSQLAVGWESPNWRPGIIFIAKLNGIYDDLLKRVQPVENMVIVDSPVAVIEELMSGD